MMKKFSIAVHGGAGPDSDYIKKHIKEYESGLKDALMAGYAILEKGGSSVDAVEAAVKLLENNIHFNAGRGSSLNEDGEVEMCSSIMSGKDGKAGAVAVVTEVKNPVTLARAVMEKTKHIYLGAAGAVRFAKELNLPTEAPQWFVTAHAREEYAKAKEEQDGVASGSSEEKINKRKHGTVGAVALDQDGNLSAATSTGGLEFCKQGRIADSSMIGAGTFADNQTCAVSTTGDGEYHMRYVTAFHISALMEYKGLSLQEACSFLIREKCGHITADMGLIAADRYGNLVAEFNSERMHRAMKSSEGELIVKIYPDHK